MPGQMTDEEIRQKAMERVGAKKGFFIHLTVYVAVNALLWIIWFFTGGVATGKGGQDFFFWPLFPMLGWGIGIVMHGLSVFAFKGDWEEKEVQKEIAKIKNKQP